MNDGSWSTWTADPACGSVTEDGAARCPLKIHHLVPGPIRLIAIVETADGEEVANARVFLTLEGALARAELLQRNEWIQNHTIQRGRQARVEVNLALGGIATQHSTSFNGIAERAIDGETNGDWNAGSCTSTGGFGEHDSIHDADDPWWTVALKGGMASVRAITIYNRADCCAEDLRGFRIALSNESLVSPNVSPDSSGESGGASRRPRFAHVLERRSKDMTGLVQCGETSFLSSHELEGPLTLECEGIASHVTIWVPGTQRTLSLCEVQVCPLRSLDCPCSQLCAHSDGMFVSVQVWGESLDEGVRQGDAEDAGNGDAVIAIADGYGLTRLLPLVTSLRRSGYGGGIHLFIFDRAAL